MTSRRDVLAGALSLPGLAFLDGQLADAAARPDAIALPDRGNFDLRGITYCDAAAEHPFSHGARRALAAYQALRAGSIQEPDDRMMPVLEKFARLINAAPDEVCYVQNTTMGEQLVLRSLGMPERGARIVTDTLHFFGSFPTYIELGRQGCDIVWLRDRDGRIDGNAIERAVIPGTRLVCLSAVSTFNGFQHDLKRVCEVAHAAGALVYADIIHAAGCLPLDVRDTGVDFAACSAYKWLMGDYGLGFLYARKDRQHLLRRTQFGYNGSLADVRYHVYPLDTPGDRVVDYRFEDTAVGRFAFGHIGSGIVAQLDHTLDYVHAIGPARINAHVRPLLTRLKHELPRMGYAVVTPPGSPAPMVTCVLPDAARVRSRLLRAGVRITAVRNRFRISLSVFNDMDDVDHLLSAIGPASIYS